jgi:hypothetical protein
MYGPFGILGRERLQLAFGPLMVEVCLAAAAEQTGEVGPGV